MRVDTFFESSTSGNLPHLVIDYAEKSIGVKAKFDLQSGSLICSIGGTVVGSDEALLTGDKRSYCLQIGFNKYMKPDYPFYLFKHSCTPNCGINKDLQLVTIKAVKKDEALSWDYSTAMFQRGWRLKCTCGQPGCRNIITDFNLLPVETQEQYNDLHIVMPFISAYINNNNL